jgi:hypothetical protein
MAYQNSNYIQLSELERDDARYKLYSLLKLMSDIKISVFDPVNSNKKLFEYDKECGDSIGTLIQQCNKSL